MLIASKILTELSNNDSEPLIPVVSRNMSWTAYNFADQQPPLTSKTKPIINCELGPRLYGGGLYGGRLYGETLPTFDFTAEFFLKCRLYGGT